MVIMLYNLGHFAIDLAVRVSYHNFACIYYSVFLFFSNILILNFDAFLIQVTPLKYVLNFIQLNNIVDQKMTQVSASFYRQQEFILDKNDWMTCIHRYNIYAIKIQCHIVNCTRYRICQIIYKYNKATCTFCVTPY